MIAKFSVVLMQKVRTEIHSKYFRSFFIFLFLSSSSLCRKWSKKKGRKTGHRLKEECQPLLSFSKAVQEL